MIERATLFRFVPLPGSYVYDHPHEFDLKIAHHRDPNWNGDWGQYHIIRNHRRWWGSDNDYREMNEAFEILNAYVAETWPRTRWSD